jgi:hypothetical protein
MSLEPALTVFPTVEEVLDEFTQSVSYNTVSVDPITGDPSNVPASVTSVTPSQEDPGISIEISGNTVTISGKYLEVFTDKTWTYIPQGQTPNEIVENVFYNEIPQEIEVLTSYFPDKTVSKLITYSVNTSAGSAVIEQTVTNNWDAGKAQMFEVLDRGSGI